MVPRCVAVDLSTPQGDVKQRATFVCARQAVTTRTGTYVVTVRRRDMPTTYGETGY